MASRAETVGERLQRLREALGLTQEQLGRAAGVPPTSLRNYEQNRRQPRLDAAVKLADVLDISLDELAGRTWPAGRGGAGKKPRKGRGAK
jgi:transcriptional regulator with XRE-family HTH domain